MENARTPAVTIDDLAAMVAKGFADMETKIDTAVGGLRDEMAGRIDAVETGLGKRIDNLAYKVDQLDAKVERYHQETKTDLSAIRGTMAGTSQTLADHEERIKELERE